MVYIDNFAICDVYGLLSGTRRHFNGVEILKMFIIQK